MELKTTYFDKPGGKENTDKTLLIARRRADELGVKNIVVATTIGDTGVKAVDVFTGYRVIAVTHTDGFRGPNNQELTEENRQIIESKGGIILTATHAFGGIHRALGRGEGPPPPGLAMGDVIAQTLRTFGQGMKVALEIAAMAADAGLVRVDEDMISVGGTRRGADTAVLLRPSYVHRFFETRVKEILCKPHF
jgi:hypothetical protein